jgi:hypothetical protein
VNGRTRLGRIAGAAVLVLLLTGCQLSESTGPIRVEPTGAATVGGEVLGNPAEDWPRTLAAAQAVADQEAHAWQDAPVLVDVTVWLDPTGEWEEVRLTYVAGAAERLLTYRSTPEDLRIERPRLAGLQLPELPTAAVAEIPALPADVLEPVDLAAAAERGLADCGADGPVRAVLYATGAPATWDGTSWTRTPGWQATVFTEAVGVTVDPTSGTPFAPLTCVEPLLLDDRD